MSSGTGITAVQGRAALLRILRRAVFRSWFYSSRRRQTLHLLAVSCRFDPNSTKFTLESVVSLRLDQHCDFIAELSVTASKEQAIENSLANIANVWAELQLDMAEYKATYKLRSTEDIFTALEDNGVTLSTMKASKYYLVFEEQVAHWERTLAVASETVEMILQVRLVTVNSSAVQRQPCCVGWKAFPTLFTRYRCWCNRSH